MGIMHRESAEKVLRLRKVVRHQQKIIKEKVREKGNEMKSNRLTEATKRDELQHEDHTLKDREKMSQ